MLLSEIDKIIDTISVHNLKKNIKFKKISRSSKLIDKFTIFIINYKNKKNEKYLIEAIRNNAPAIISEKYIKEIKLPQFIVKDTNIAVKILLKELFPYSPHRTIAITGTNGKTSVAWYISELCKYNNINCKMLGTLGYYINGKKIKDTLLTTPAYEELYQFCFDRKIKNYNFVFETSSHALSQNRISNIPIDVGAITNLSLDHLDYHKDFYSYKNAKLKLFKMYLKSEGEAIINSRIKNFKNLFKVLKKRKIKTIVYGSKDIYFNKSKKVLYLNLNKKKYLINNIQLSQIEKENLECAIACCSQFKIKPKKIINYLKKITNAPGRLQLIECKKKNIKVIIDYAHTPDALKKILFTYTNKKIKPSLVFGCGGNRDISKRKLMGKIANENADKIYITDDNPRNENPSKIRKTIIKYCSKGIEISNRKKAIEYAIRKMQDNEILIIAGKGHENYQIFKNKIKKFDDSKIVKNTINKYL